MTIGEGGYGSFDDPYVYRGTNVLKNIAGTRDETALRLFETAATAIRSSEPLPHGRFGVWHYRNIHRHLFQDVYRWAGRYRTIRVAKGNSAFCFPENISNEMNRIFGWLHGEQILRGRTRADFVEGAAYFLSELNAIHPFRDGNGRTQLTFMALIAVRAGHRLEMERLNPGPFLAAMIRSFHGDPAGLERQFRDLVG